MKKIGFFFILSLSFFVCSGHDNAEDTTTFRLLVINETQQPAELVTVELLNAGTAKLIKAALTNHEGIAVFYRIAPGNYLFKISHAGYKTYSTPIYNFPLNDGEKNEGITITLQPVSGILKDVSLSSIKPLIQYIQGKVIINVDASVTNAGTTVLEVLEKSPGIMVDNNGIISLQGKTGVMVMIDDKQTYLSGSELLNLLRGMSSSQVEQIELISNPPAKYDASGSAGIINIKTKKGKLKGFNGTFTISVTRGRYSKINNSLVLNYRNSKYNTFLTYSNNLNKYYTEIYALRRYYSPAGILISKLEQPTFFSGHVFNNTLKGGIDFYASEKTTVGFSFTGVISKRRGTSEASATWMNAAGSIDSAIATSSASSGNFKNWAANINLKHVYKDHAISADIDWVKYEIHNKQSFTNHFISPGGYTDASQGDIPSGITIVSAKADYTKFLGKYSKLESGFKISRITTDNLADYRYFDGFQWNADYEKSNHFLYNETIHAFYSGWEKKHKRIVMQAGLRYEYTHYHANQLGNIIRKDSSFSRNYQGLFPAGFITFHADSANSFTLTTGRRIDRPAFQKLNPFIFIINKYTYNQGNPYIQPQFSWNMQVSHQYKEFLTTTLSFSTIKNYFSQLFLNGADDILIYTEGNVGRMYNYGLSVNIQISPFKWWSLLAQANLNYKKLQGYLQNDYASSVTQLNTNLNNQFNIGKKYTAELSGYYTTKARNDLQELLSPTGQLSAGISKPVLKNKGTLKLSARDIFYTQAMEGVTQFEFADEYFKLNYDTRVVNLSFTYRFGNQLKTIKRNIGGAGDEMKRAGNDN